MAKANVLLGMGPEPTFADPSSFSDHELQLAFTWYNYRYDLTDAVKWLIAHFKDDGYPANVIALYERNWRHVPMWVCVIARALNKGIDVPEDVRIRWISRLEQLENNWVAKAPVVEEDSAIVEQSNLERRISEAIGDIEAEIDKLYISEYTAKPSDFYAILLKYQIKGRFAQRVIDYYAPLLEEIDAKVDERLDRKQRLAYKAFVQAIIDDCNRLSDNAKAARKPRKKRAKKINLSKVKYCVEDTDLKARSLDPAKIIGALTVYVYNRRRRKLHMLVADSVDGLKIVRSTILNIDEKRSSSKTIRNPQKLFAQLADVNKKGTMAAMFTTGIKAKQGPASGRLSVDSLIIKAFNT